MHKQITGQKLLLTKKKSEKNWGGLFKNLYEEFRGVFSILRNFEEFWGTVATLPWIYSSSSSIWNVFRCTIWFSKVVDNQINGELNSSLLRWQFHSTKYLYIGENVLEYVVFSNTNHVFWISKKITYICGECVAYPHKPMVVHQKRVGCLKISTIPK